MEKPQTLSKRKFNINDGELYVILVTIDGFEYGFVKEGKGKPIIGSDATNSKTFKALSTAQSAAARVLDTGGYKYRIVTVKEVFEPAYRVGLDVKQFFAGTIPPRIIYNQEWIEKGAEQPDVYRDKDKAKEVLEKYKLTVLTYHHSRIMELKYITIK